MLVISRSPAKVVVTRSDHAGTANASSVIPDAQSLQALELSTVTSEQIDEKLTVAESVVVRDCLGEMRHDDQVLDAFKACWPDLVDEEDRRCVGCCALLGNDDVAVVVDVRTDRERPEDRSLEL